MSSYADVAHKPKSESISEYNKDGAGSAGNTHRRLTHSLDCGKEGLMPNPTCSIDGCTRKTLARGWCGLHYQRWYYTGDPLKVRRKSRSATFWSHVVKGERPSDCWIWHGPKHASRTTGYGWTGAELAHRFAYSEIVGPIPDGMQIDHLCRVRLCVNPAHLEPVTPRENILRSMAPNAIAVRTGRCQRGHALDGANVYVAPDGARRCRACVALRRKAARQVR